MIKIGDHVKITTVREKHEHYNGELGLVQAIVRGHYFVRVNGSCPKFALEELQKINPNQNANST